MEARYPDASSHTHVHNRSPQSKGGTYSAEKALRGYENEQVRYLDAEPLKRPLTMPNSAKIVLAILLVIAAIIAGVMIYFYYDNVLNAENKAQATLEENLSRKVNLDLPDIVAFMGMSDEEIMSSLEQTGETFYERTAVGELEEGGFEIVKLPDDLSVFDAASMYLTGLSNLSATDAARLFNGSWDMTVSREDGVPNIYLWFADFTSSSLESAVQNAIISMGLDTAEVTESGIDTSGNTYTAGIVGTEDEGIYNWRVSALPFKDMYDINGLPDDSYFIGIRFTV